MLASFLTSNPGALRAAQSLRAGAEVGLSFPETDGSWRLLRAADGGLVLEPGEPVDPDFQLRIPAKAIEEFCASEAQDLGDLGVAFFELLASREPERRIEASFHSGLVKLTRRGWVSLLALGGSKVVMWMARKGLHGPGAVAGALARFKSK